MDGATLMRYFHKTNQVIALNDLQIKQGLANGLTELTPEELDAHLNPEPVIIIPEQVTRAQGKVALVQAGLFQDVVTYINNLSEPSKTLAQIAFNETNTWQRSSEWLNQIADDLNITQEQLDNLFITAAGIEL